MSKNFLQKQCKTVENTLHEKGFTHLKLLARGGHLIIYSKDGADIINRARLTHLDHKNYQLSMADHVGRWEPTPYTGDLDELLKILTEDFAFALINF